MLAELVKALDRLGYPLEHSLPYDEYVQAVKEIRENKPIGEPLWITPDSVTFSPSVLPPTIMLKGCMLKIGAG